MKPSATIEVHALTMQMKAAGEEVLSLCVGEPDFSPPAEIVDAIAAAAKRGDTRYTDVVGTPELRSAIASDLASRKGVEYDVAEVVVANGAKQAVYQALLALVGPGDDACVRVALNSRPRREMIASAPQVIIPAPYWVSYPSMVEMAGATHTSVTTTLESGFKLAADHRVANSWEESKITTRVESDEDDPRETRKTVGRENARETRDD